MGFVPPPSPPVPQTIEPINMEGGVVDCRPPSRSIETINQEGGRFFTAEPTRLPDVDVTPSRVGWFYLVLIGSSVVFWMLMGGVSW